MSFGFDSITGAASGAWNRVSSGAASALQGAGELGASALSHASSLGRQGLDLGRQAVNTVGELGVKGVGDAAIAGIGKAQAFAEAGIRTGVMSAGKGVHEAADYARSHIGGDGVLAQTARGAIDTAETYVRTDIGVVGGVAKGVVGLAGSAGQLGVLAAEYRFSPAAHDAINARIAGAVRGGEDAVGDYAAKVVADPSRLPGDIAGAATSAFNAGVDFGRSTVADAKQAIAEGHGPESLGLVLGEGVTYIAPVGGEARIAVEGAGALARGVLRAGAEDTARTLVEGGAATITRDGAETLARAEAPTAGAVAGADGIAAPGVSSVGRIDYGALDALGRPTGVRATITEDMIGAGTAANPSIIPPGWSGNGTLFNEARGHLLGRQLGGSGDVVENLVTLQQNPANSPVMRGFENRVRSAVEGGQTVNYASTPIYDGANLVPRGVTLGGRGSGGFDLDVTILNPVGR